VNTVSRRFWSWTLKALRGSGRCASSGCSRRLLRERSMSSATRPITVTSPSDSLPLDCYVPYKNKRLRAAYPCPALRKVHATIRSNEGLGMEHELPYHCIRNADSRNRRWTTPLSFPA
jgi:hypothetical protein